MEFASVEKFEVADVKSSENDKFDTNNRPKALPYVLCNVFTERFCTGGISGENLFF